MNRPPLFSAPSTAVDAPYVWGLACLYLVVSSWILPQSEWLRGLGGPFIAFAALHFEGSVRRGQRMMTMATVMLSFGLLAVLVLPTAPAMGGHGGSSSIVGFIGVQLALLVRAVARWEPPSEPTEPIRLASALLMAAWCAVGISLIATIPIGLSLAGGSRSTMEVVWVYPAYFVGAAGVAVSVWGLQRLRPYATGRYLTGVVAASCVYGAVAPVAAALDDGKGPVAEYLLMALAIGSLMGPAFAFDRNAFDAT